MEKIWFNKYPAGVPQEINPQAFESLVDQLDKVCKEYHDLPAFYNLGTTLTFSEIDTYSLHFASYLQNVLRLKQGDRVGIMLPNILQYPIAMLGILRAGLIVVNINPLYTPPELTHQLNDSGAETIIVMSNFAHTVEAVLNNTPLRNVIVTDIGDMLPFFKATLINIVLKYVKRQIPDWNIPNAIKFKNVLREGKAGTFSPVKVTAEDIAFLQYTGGTTGVSKGAILTHRNIVANIQQATAWFKPCFTVGQEIIITALPLYHIFSLTANCLFLMTVGGLNVLITNPRDLNSMIKDMMKFKFSIFTGVNTLFNALIKHKNFGSLDFSNLKISLGGGMAVQSAVADVWQKRTGKVLLEAYGLTETSPCVAINPVNLSKYNGTVGLPVSSTDVCILDDDQNELSLGSVGELAIKGPQVMRGYWHNDAETKKVFTKDGWLLTGDIALITPEGFVRILERKKDMIIVSGFNVYPNEVEDVLAQIPGVREAAVVASIDGHSGEVVQAFIVKEDPSLTREEILEFCKQKLTGYKIPKLIEFCQELPKTNVGKVLRRALRK